MTDNLFTAISTRLEQTPEQILVERPGGRRYTYGEALQESARLANRLAKLGLRPGDRLAVQIDKSPEMLLLYLACLRAGGVYLPLNTAYTEGELRYFLDNAEPTVVIAQAGKTSTLASLSAAAGACVATLGTARDGTLVEELDHEPTTHEPAKVGMEAPAAILYTSGTTGRPKGAVLSHGNLLANAEALIDAWRFSAEDRLLHALPVFHVHGLFVACNVPILAGARITFLDKFDVDEVIEHLPHCTVMMGVPTFYVRLLQDERFNHKTTENLRLFVSGSAPLLAETHEAVRARTGHGIVERYGMTETNMNTSNPYDGERRAGTVGFPLPGVEVRIVDTETLAELPHGEIGGLEVRGPNVFGGYWRMPEKTAEDFREDGFFITGDLAYVDEDGYIHIVGRAKDLIISGGYNVYPKEVEQIVDDLPAVVESAVFGVPHPDLGEAVTAVVVPQPGRHVSESDVLGAMKDKIAKYKRPKRVIVVDSLPRNVMGKVQKNMLREQFGDIYRQSSES
ncbi:malonyl-CoA/methylmalonyl-CoA synthetase [Natronocella acetinitrilica]|uniref:Malonyl-CoA/methylmalonyl-CoA synthetase n=1 Tax=Natronocella acetinitrilica TaxID=414046 RepID=A0AAE3KAV7_9GAMM|nr:malonyl-CoA synthase [Natronocella acetinitrilica]MCP1674840.1 malonyl-CoA/methylmalonyl-CoA synthetase [Natronocella acetinitrilica]